MAYSDFFNDAKLSFTFDNTFAHTLTGSNPNAIVDTNPDGTSGTPVYVADAPAGLGSTYSLKLNGYTTLPSRKRFRLLSEDTGYNVDGVSKTATAWIKVSENSPQPNQAAIGAALTIYSDSINQSGGEGFFRIPMGTLYLAPGAGADRFPTYQLSQTSTSTSAFANITKVAKTKITLNEWHHVAVVFRELPTYDLVERAIWLDGVCINYSYTSGVSGNAMQWGTFGGTLGGLWTPSFLGSESATTKLISNLGFWNRALTKEEIRAQAWYAHQNEDYQTTVLAKNPTYYARFDNADKTIDHTVLGTATNWGALSDDKSSFYVNESGIQNGKAWRVISSATAANNYTANTDADMMSGMPSLIKTGEFSIEFWTKFSDLPTVITRIIELSSANADGAFNISMQSGGYPYLSFAYKSGATTYPSGSMGATTDEIASPSGTGTELFTLHPGGTNLKNWCDNKWHHFVYTFSKSDGYNGTAGSYWGILFVDGAKIATRQWTNTYGWLDGTGNATSFALGMNSNITTLRDRSIAELAFYPRRLSEAEVAYNFKVGVDYVSDQGAVRYYDGSTWQLATAAKTWNGTAWVDWVKKYWNGTAWIDLP